MLRGDARGAEVIKKAGLGGGHLQPDEAQPRSDPHQGGHESRGYGQLHLLYCC